MSIEIEWVPRSLNEYADSLSRVIDFDDWCVSTGFSAYILSLFGPFTLDRFASPDSAKCARSYSKFRCPGRFKSAVLALLLTLDSSALVP